MQRTVEQRHSTRRRTSSGRHPRVKTFGFTARQQPFIIVLVANWIFSLAFFMGMKLVWHWQPEDWGIADRIALVIKDSVFALLPGVIGICIVAGDNEECRRLEFFRRAVRRCAEEHQTIDLARLGRD